MRIFILFYSKMTNVMCKVSIVTLDHRILYSTKFTHAENDKYLSTFVADIKLDDRKVMDILN